MKKNTTHLVETSLEDALRAYRSTIATQMKVILTVSDLIARCLREGGKVLICGNGGSAADAQHIAAEFVNRFRLDRRPLPAIALTTDTSVLTAIGNDYTFDLIFSKQVEALAETGDVLWGISTSGRSPNILKAFDTAREKGAMTIGFSGKDSHIMATHCDVVLEVDSKDTPRIQEVQIFLAHLICDLVEKGLFS